MGSRTYRESASIRGSVKVLTAGAGTPRLGRPQAQAARIAIGREVRHVDGDVGKLLMHDALEKMGVGGLFPPPGSPPPRRDHPESRRWRGSNRGASAAAGGSGGGARPTAWPCH